jgi:hypothetical protein
VKSAKQFAHTACGILPCEQKKAENLTKAEQKQQTKSRTANYATVEFSPLGRAVILIFRDVAQLVARVLWEHAGGFRSQVFQKLENP